jgi:hypothetical protein
MLNSFQRVVDETGMTAFIPAHQPEEFADFLVCAAALHFLVEHAAGKFSRQRGHQEVDELPAQLVGQGVDVDLVPVGIALEMALVRVRTHFGDQFVPFLPDARHVETVHLVEVGGVEPRVEHGRFDSGLGRLIDVGGLRSREIGFNVLVHARALSEKLNSHSSMNSKSPVARVHVRSSALARVIVAVRRKLSQWP